MDYEKEIEALKSQVSDLAAKVFQTGPALKADNPSPYPDLPAWEVVERPAGGGIYAVTLTPTPWDDQFEEGGVTYRRYYIPTTHGELVCLHPSDSRGARAILRFKSDIARSVPCLIGAENFGTLQVQINSADITQYTAVTGFTAEVRQGENIVSISTDGIADRINLRAGFF